MSELSDEEIERRLEFIRSGFDSSCKLPTIVSERIEELLALQAARAKTDRLESVLIEARNLAPDLIDGCCRNHGVDPETMEVSE